MEQLPGLSALSPKDQERVAAYMSKNAADGVIDERTDITDDQYSKKTRMPEKDPSPLLTATLLPYQREALAWMVNQEASNYRGGILADEMGMGKTIQAISLILENPRADAPPPKTGKKKSMQQSPLVRGGTLVVCPVVAVMQWKSEIERFVEPGHLSIYIHHGPKRDDLPSRIASHDIVLTTYSIIENEVRKTLGWSKVACKYCKKKYLPEKLVTHNKYFCGPNAKKTLRQDKQQRKAPRRKLAAGEEEASDEDEFGYPKKPAAKPKAKAPPKKSGKKKVIEDSSDDDELVAKKSKGKSPLHAIHWTRIVLDEAHYIKDRKCNTARGVFELKSDYKWCLTGTHLYLIECFAYQNLHSVAIQERPCRTELASYSRSFDSSRSRRTHTITALTAIARCWILSTCLLSRQKLDELDDLTNAIAFCTLASPIASVPSALIRLSSISRSLTKRSLSQFSRMVTWLRARSRCFDSRTTCSSMCVCSNLWGQQFNLLTSGVACSITDSAPPH